MNKAEIVDEILDIIANANHNDYGIIALDVYNTVVLPILQKADMDKTLAATANGLLQEVQGFFEDPTASKESVMPGTGDGVRRYNEAIYHENPAEIKDIIRWYTGLEI